MGRKEGREGKLTWRTHSVVDEEEQALTRVERDLGLHVGDDKAEWLLPLHQQSSSSDSIPYLISWNFNFSGAPLNITMGMREGCLLTRFEAISFRFSKLYFSMYSRK